jgi:hypothetical protein
MMHLAPLPCRAAALLLSVCAGVSSVGAELQALPTPLERNGYTHISTSAEISEYLDGVAAAVPFAFKDVLGKSVQGRPIDALVFRASTSGPPRPASRRASCSKSCWHAVRGSRSMSRRASTRPVRM